MAKTRALKDRAFYFAGADMSQDKTAHSTESIRQMIEEVDQLLKEHDAQYGKPPPLNEEDQDRLNTEIRNYHRNRQAP